MISSNIQKYMITVTTQINKMILDNLRESESLLKRSIHYFACTIFELIAIAILWGINAWNANYSLINLWISFQAALLEGILNSWLANVTRTVPQNIFIILGEFEQKPWKNSWEK